MVAREEIVEQLCQGAATGMIDVARSTDVTASEVFSAYMTLALRAIQYAKSIDGNVEAMRNAVERMYAELPPPVVN